MANSKNNALIDIVKFLNFNEDYPENHNFCTTSLEGSYVNVYNSETKTIDKINKDDFYNKVLNKSIQKVDQIILLLEVDDQYNNIKPKYKDLLEEITKNPLIFEKKNNKTIYKKNINEMSYNNKNMVQQTWLQHTNNIIASENLDSPNNNYNSDDECAFIDYTTK